MKYIIGSIQFSKALEINDLIMRQDGTIYYNWGDDQIASPELLSAIGSSDTYSSTASVAAKIVTKNIYGIKSATVLSESDDTDINVCSVPYHYHCGKKVYDYDYSCGRPRTSVCGRSITHEDYSSCGTAHGCGSGGC